MSLPAQLQKQVDNAQAIIAQHYGSDAVIADVGDAAATTPAAAAAASTDAPVTETAPVVVDAPAQDAAPVAQNTATDDENNATFAQRWRTLQGKHNVLLRQNQEQSQRLANLETLIAQMQASPASHEPQQHAPTRQAHLSDKDVTEYGEDMTDYVRRAARDEMAPLAQAVQALHSQLQTLNGVVPAVQNVAQNQQRSAQREFLQALTGAVPDWQTLNDDPRVHAWLLAVDPMTGLDRQTYLRDAEQAMNLDRVVSIFRAAKSALGLNHPPTQGASAPAAQSAAQRLAKQVAPGRSNASTSPPQERVGKTWARADIAAFFQDKLRGAYKGREAEAAAMEQDIFKAQGEGRVA